MITVSNFLKFSRFIISGLFSLFCTGTINASQLDVIGGSYPPMIINPDKSTGLAEVIVVHDLDNVSLKYRTVSPQKVKVYTYSNLGAAYSTPVETLSYDGESIVINNPLGDTGYIFSINDSNEYYWIVDYSKHLFIPEALNIAGGDGCYETTLDFIGKGGIIPFYSINGRQETLSRDLELTYNSLEFDDSSKQFVEKEFKKNISYVNEKISIIPAVTCQTECELSGDRFLKYWNKEISIKSDIITPIATSVVTQAITDDEGENGSEASNEISANTEGLGGSAPATISFLSYISDAVIHCEWQMAKDESFEDILYRFTQQDLTYTFTSEGTVFVRFIGSNADGSCESFGDTYTVSIGASQLLIPNAFSPNDDGINDEWKVSFKSLIDFKCWIFDRQGHELYFFDDPKSGWDGKYKGKPVNPGVYYYVINATGSDGKKYKKSGDINILKSKGQFSSNPQD